MGTCAVTLHKPDKVAPIGPFQCRIADVALSSSYATGGDTLTLASLGLKKISSLKIVGYTGTPALFHVLQPVYGATDETDLKIMARDVGTGVEVTNTQDVHTQTMRVEAWGDGPFS